MFNNYSDIMLLSLKLKRSCNTNFVARSCCSVGHILSLYNFFK
ncbi:unnamed protein product [Meloidogyne enterolobii]|uniref:Uncharacterized protein n=1 Tax=Meloidogyne enterolobii TaxID=390850 RepID=A0ACB0YK55_MELEN